jgi:Domain of unknown function (DUF4112)
MQQTLDVLVWIVGIGLILAVVAFFTLKWFALRIATRVAAASERRLAAKLGPGIARSGLASGVPADELERRRFLAQLDRLAWLMDRVVPLPVIGGVGLDAVLGLVPLAGDLASLSISAVMIIRAAQLGAPPELVSRLIAIHCIDLALGAVPGLGDLVDVGYQANRRSAALVREWIATTSRL